MEGGNFGLVLTGTFQAVHELPDLNMIYDLLKI